MWEGNNEKVNLLLVAVEIPKKSIDMLMQETKKQGIDLKDISILVKMILTRQIEAAALISIYKIVKFLFTDKKWNKYAYEYLEISKEDIGSITLEEDNMELEIEVSE